MNSQAAVEGLRSAIITAASEMLKRKLAGQERNFIEARGGFIALEAIFDTINKSTSDEIERYLNSEP